MYIPITSIIGSKVMHGSPGYEVEETIKVVTFLKDIVEIGFESDAFSQMTPDEFEYFLRYEELSYKEQSHGGMSSLFFSYYDHNEQFSKE